MGRLFWKIFLAFWLALLAAAGFTGTTIWLLQSRGGDPEHELAIGRPQRFETELAAATLA